MRPTGDCVSILRERQGRHETSDVDSRGARGRDGRVGRRSRNRRRHRIRSGQPLVDAAGKVRDEAMLRTPLLPEDRKYADLDGRRMKQFVMEVDAISLKDRDSGNLFWGRNVGTAGHVATQDWVEGYFRKHGLQNIHRMPFDLQPVWTPKSWDISFTSGGQTFKLPSARPAARAASTPPGGLELDVVWVGGGTDADFIGRDVKGKAVLIQDIPLPGDIRHSISLEGSVARAFEKGAAAVGIVFGISDNFAIWQATAGRPGFNLGFEDGIRLRELIGQGQPVKVKLQLAGEMRPGLKTASVVGTLPGRPTKTSPSSRTWTATSRRRSTTRRVWR